MDLEGQTTTAAIDADQSAVNLFDKPNRPVTLKFEDVVYKIRTRKAGKSDEKLILNEISGVVISGEILAMLGPSGSGKTTLLTALGGRLGGGPRLSGSITYNGKPFSNQTKRATGFVTQDDVLYEHLTVAETLIFTALLRLPGCLTPQQKAANADAVIEELGLDKCRNSVIGGPLLRGVSGGERKRVSIGQEMLVNPSLLFLDEPTSGLDSTTAQKIVATLLGLACGGRTVVITIHQPSSRLFYMFHKVLLLSDGNPLFFGKASAAMEYFSTIGYAPSVAMNPSDFLLDLANGIGPGEAVEDPNTVKRTLVLAYNNNLGDRIRAELRDGSNGRPLEGGDDKHFGRWSVSWFQQFRVLLRRGVKEGKHGTFSALNIFQVLTVSFLCGLLWFRSDISRLQDQIGLLFFYAGFWGFYPMFQAIFTFPQERLMLAKERSSCMYRLSSAFMALTVRDLPMELVLPTVFVLISYWMAGLKHTAAHFLYTLSALLLNVLVAQGLGLALGALIMDQKRASTVGAVILLSFLLASGFYVQHVPAFISWIKYLSISNYTYKLLLGSQYSATDTYPCGPGSAVCAVGDFPAVRLVGLDGQLPSALALVVMLVGYRLLAYGALMRIGIPR